MFQRVVRRKPYSRIVAETVLQVSKALAHYYELKALEGKEMCLLPTNTKEWNKKRRLAMDSEVEQINRVLKEKAEIQSYNQYRRELVSRYRLKQIDTMEMDDLERKLSEAHLERLRKIRKGY